MTTINTQSNGARSGVPVLDVDEVFPTLTTVLPSMASSPVTATDETPGVSDVLANVLDWRPRTDDPSGFDRALQARFGLRTTQGHVETTFYPMGVATVGGDFAVTGGQASLFTRFQGALSQINPLLNGFKPLRVDADLEDCEAFRTVAGDALTKLVAEIGNPGTPRIARVDSYLGVLVEWTPATPWAAIDSDHVGGVVGQIRDKFGFRDRNVNSVADEKAVTGYATFRDLVLDITRSWAMTRGQFMQHRGGGDGFLGTDLVLIQRALQAADAQVTELEAILDSVFIPKSERQTLRLNQAGLTLDDLFGWMHEALTNEATVLLQAGRDGIESALSPLMRQLHEVVQRNLMLPAAPKGVTVILPLGKKLPAGMSAGRTRLALDDVDRLLHDLKMLTARIHRRPDPRIVEVSTDPATQPVTKRHVTVRLWDGRRKLRLQIEADLRNTAWDSSESVVLTATRHTRTSDHDHLEAIFDVTPWAQSDVVTRVAGPSTVDATAIVIDANTGRVVDTMNFCMPFDGTPPYYPPPNYPPEPPRTGTVAYEPPPAGPLVSEAPVSEAPVSEAPVSEAPASDAPVSEAPPVRRRVVAKKAAAKKAPGRTRSAPAKATGDN